MKKDKDFYLAYSPERESGNEIYSTSTIPKIVGADTPKAREMVALFMKASSAKLFQ